MRIIVQKFGGTSVATPDGRERVADWAERSRRDGLHPVIVVSAMGRRGDPYATDTLLSLAVEVFPETPARELDLLLGCGEVISGVVVASTLHRRGVPAVVLTGGQAGILTDENFGSANILRVDPEPVLSHLRENRIVVVAGFQGVTRDGQVTTLGRGGSDTTASALGGALRAELVEIFTDVDGIKTADPRIVPGARTLAVTTYDEVAQLAHYGAKVVHPRAVELAMQHNVPLRVRSTFADTPGTLVTYSVEAASTLVSELRPQGVITGVAQVPAMAQIQVETDPGDPRGVEMLRRLAAAGISLDLFNISPERKQFCVAEGRAARAEAIVLEMGLHPRVRTGCAKVSVVGAGMHGRPGVMATVAEVLNRAGVEILQTADSHVTISCLVAGDQMEQAVRALHEGFGLG